MTFLTSVRPIVYECPVLVASARTPVEPKLVGERVVDGGAPEAAGPWQRAVVDGPAVDGGGDGGERAACHGERDRRDLGGDGSQREYAADRNEVAVAAHEVLAAALQVLGLKVFADEGRHHGVLRLPGLFLAKVARDALQQLRRGVDVVLAVSQHVADLAGQLQLLDLGGGERELRPGQRDLIRARLATAVTLRCRSRS